MMISILELRHLRMLEALVESCNLSRTAQRLHLTQSAISHQVKQIDEFYGASLFERKTQPLRLTNAGQRLHGLALSLLAQVAEAERDIARIVEGQAGRLRVAVECHTCFEWLMPAMDVFRKHWPEIELDLVSGFHADPWFCCAKTAPIWLYCRSTAKATWFITRCSVSKSLALFPPCTRLRARNISPRRILQTRH